MSDEIVLNFSPIGLDGSIKPLSLKIQPGTATAAELAELFTAIDNLYQTLANGRGLKITTTNPDHWLYLELKRIYGE